MVIGSACFLIPKEEEEEEELRSLWGGAGVNRVFVRRTSLAIPLSIP